MATSQEPTTTAQLATTNQQPPPQSSHSPGYYLRERKREREREETLKRAIDGKREKKDKEKREINK